jgi:hypothetical protein
MTFRVLEPGAALSHGMFGVEQKLGQERWWS